MFCARVFGWNLLLLLLCSYEDNALMPKWIYPVIECACHICCGTNPPFIKNKIKANNNQSLFLYLIVFSAILVWLFCVFSPFILDDSMLSFDTPLTKLSAKTKKANNPCGLLALSAHCTQYTVYAFENGCAKNNNIRHVFKV